MARADFSMFLALAGALGCAHTSNPRAPAGSEADGPTAGQPAAGVGSARATRSRAGVPPDAAPEVHQLLTDLLAGQACSRLEGKFMGLSASSGDITEGRLWIERCSSEPRDGEVKVALSGRGWRWIDRTKEKLGASFSVSQYVRMQADVSLVGSTDFAYAPKQHVLNLWLVHTPPVQADVRPLGSLDVEPKSAWGTLLGAAAGVFGLSPESQASESVSNKGERHFEQKLRHGMSVAMDLCTGQTYSKLGDLKPGELPEAPYPSPNRTWIENARVRVRAGGVDLAGPMRPNGALHVELQGQDGPPLRAQLICDTAAAAVANAFLKSQQLPGVDALAEGVLRSGDGPLRLTASTQRCPLVLMTTPVATQGGKDRSAEPSEFKFMAYSEHSREEALVPCSNESSSAPRH